MIIKWACFYIKFIFNSFLTSIFQKRWVIITTILIVVPQHNMSNKIIKCPYIFFIGSL